MWGRIPNRQELEALIFGIDSEAAFSSAALQIFQFQYEHNPVYNSYCNYIGVSPAVDPHGDPIPDESGKMKKIKTQPLTEAPSKRRLSIIALANSSDEFLKYPNKLGLAIGDIVEICEVEDFDKSLLILHKKKSITLSNEAAGNLLVKV